MKLNQLDRVIEELVTEEEKKIGDRVRKFNPRMFADREYSNSGVIIAVSDGKEWYSDKIATVRTDDGKIVKVQMNRLDKY